jgi:hypothetical protein
MRRQRLSESLRDALAKFRGGLKRKKPEAILTSRPLVRVRTGPELRFCCHWRVSATVAPWNRPALRERTISRNASRLKQLPPVSVMGAKPVATL